MDAARFNARMARLLFCNYEFPPIGGGGGTCSKYLARELARRGHMVDVLTTGYGALPPVARRGNLTIHRLNAPRAKPGQSNPKEMAAYSLIAAATLLAGRIHKPDVVVSFHSIPSGLAAFPYCKLRGVPHISLLRGGDVPGWLPERMATWHRLTLPINRLVVYTSAACLANSDGLRALAQRAFPRKKIGVLQNGVDLREFSPPSPPRSTWQRGYIQLLFVGRITAQKGIDVLLRAMARERFATWSWKLDIVGDGPQLAEYVELAKQLGIIGRVGFHGWMQHRDLRKRYDDADVLVFPSRYEGMPNTVLEATACGLPVIATRTAGTVQILQDGVNGRLVNIDDEPALSAAIEELMSRHPLRMRMGDTARRIAEEKWSWSARAVELENLINRIIR
ncbi:glycosyltransferase family 4 protein [Candidatus Sumerlaeota bacterium]|nr:glycosyltransferase family 4 protein [Candidatus Sumerlaeota bacterium]